MMNKLKFSLIFALILSLSLTACGGKDGPAPQDSGSRDSVTAYVGSNIFEESLDPVKGSMSHGFPFICNALLRVTPDSEYVGDLADSWAISDDGLTYTFTLKKDIRFSDGSDFTAEDVVFTYETVRDNQANNESVDLTRLASVEAPDDHTVVFTLTERYSPFFDTAASLQIVPSDSYDSSLFDTAPIGTGAYQVMQYDRDQQIILTANEHSFAGAPAISRVTLVNMDQDAAFAAAQSGQLDVVMVGAGYAHEEVPGMTLIPFETMDVRNISLPVRPRQEITGPDGKPVTIGNDVTSDPAVREALAIGIDRQRIIDQAFNGVGLPAVNFTDNLRWANTNDFTDNRADEAMALLEKAGWTDASGDGVREKDGTDCAFTVYTSGGDQDRYQLAEALAQNARELGIAITVKTATWDEIATLEHTDGVVWGWGQYSPTVLSSLFSSDRFMKGLFDNVVGYENPQVDEYIARALAASTQEEAIDAWKQVQTLADADYPYLYLVNIEHCYFVRDGLDLSQDTQVPHPHGHGSPVVCNLKDWNWKE